MTSVGDGRLVGRVERRFTFSSRDYALVGGGEPLLIVSGPWYKPWTFDVRRAGGNCERIACWQDCRTAAPGIGAQV